MRELPQRSPLLEEAVVRILSVFVGNEEALVQLKFRRFRGVEFRLLLEQRRTHLVSCLSPLLEGLGHGRIGPLLHPRQIAQGHGEVLQHVLGISCQANAAPRGKHGKCRPARDVLEALLVLRGRSFLRLLLGKLSENPELGRVAGPLHDAFQRPVQKLLRQGHVGVDGLDALFQGAVLIQYRRRVFAKAQVRLLEGLDLVGDHRVPKLHRMVRAELLLQLGLVVGLQLSPCLVVFLLALRQVLLKLIDARRDVLVHLICVLDDVVRRKQRPTASRAAAESHQRLGSFGVREGSGRSDHRNEGPWPATNTKGEHGLLRSVDHGEGRRARMRTSRGKRFPVSWIG
mmetsp:Transcript_44640/g.123715  ORF Transcript_44640/g.123715 Transcript_44640/m.123715 type:complete len:343 (-) Transcript_44640:6-1034(-)